MHLCTPWRPRLSMCSDASNDFPLLGHLRYFIRKINLKSIKYMLFQLFNTKAIVLGFLITKRREKGGKKKKNNEQKQVQPVGKFIISLFAYPCCSQLCWLLCYCSGFRYGYRLLDLVLFPVALEFSMATWIHLFPLFLCL